MTDFHLWTKYHGWRVSVPKEVSYRICFGKVESDLASFVIQNKCLSNVNTFQNMSLINTKTL